MKISNFKIITLIILNAFFFIFPIVTRANPVDQYACLLNDSGEITDTKECYARPDHLEVKFYRGYLCKTEPVAPNPTTPINLSSCELFFENTLGVTVDVQQNQNSPTLSNYPNDIPLPTRGTYQYVYMEIDPSVRVQAQAHFSRTMIASDGSRGNWCWTLTGQRFGVSDFVNPFASCADQKNNSLSTYTTSITNSLDGRDSTIINNLSFLTSKGDSLQAYLLTSDNKLATAARDSLGNIAKIGGYLPQTIQITDTTLGLIINYNVQQGTSVAIPTMRPNELNHFSNGPFDIFITPE
jgi:hypothetical protein